MEKRVDISAFRSAVFDHFDAVTRRPGGRVVVERRGYGARAVLTSEQYLEELERQLERLRSIVAKLQADSARASFRLIGTAQLHVGPDEVLIKSRARQADLLARKRAAL